MPRWWSRNCGALCPGREFFGCTGPRLRAAGVRTVVDAASLAVVGLVEVVSHIPRIYGEYRKLLAAASAGRPDLAILTDSPDFHLRVARKLHRQGIPVVYLVAPQAWAWRKGRVREMRRTIRRLLCIFPFEEEFFTRHGVRTTYIGHPLAGLVRPSLTPGRVFSETQAGCGASLNYGAARKPPGRISAPFAGAARRGAADLPGTGRERRVAGLGHHRGSVFYRASGALADSGDRRGKLGRHGARRSRAGCKRYGHRGSCAAGHPHGHVL